MGVKRKRIISLIGDLLNDSTNVANIDKILVQLGVKYQYYKDLDDKEALASTIIILNTKCDYGYDANSFIIHSISHRIPIIVVYTDMKTNTEIHDSVRFSESVLRLWDKMPGFKYEHYQVPTIHIPLCDLERIIKSNDFREGTALASNDYYLRKKENE